MTEETFFQADKLLLALQNYKKVLKIISEGHIGLATLVKDDIVRFLQENINDLQKQFDEL